jgi:hypothetical protein
MKTTMDKKVNRIVRTLNKDLEKDVFGNRFWCRQVRKAKEYGTEYYLYELKDRKDPSRDKMIRGWLSGFEITTFHTLTMEMNDFIVTSNFWEEYKNNK